MKQLFLSVLFLLLPMLASAAVEIDGIYYYLDSYYKTATVTYGNWNPWQVKENDGRYSGDIVIPESVKYEDVEYSVTSIVSNTFQDCSGLTSITIPNSVTSIGNATFYGCSGLTSITIPNSVTSIGNATFYGCSGLTSITIPNSVTSIDSQAFYGCSGLTSITIPNSVNSIDLNTFSGCGLTSIIVETSNPNYDSRDNCNAIIKKEDNELIVGCMNTIIPNSVTSIGSEAFRDCSGLTSIEIPNSVTNIGAYAFYGCSGLTTITIPNSVTSIGGSAFRGCGLTSIIVETGNPIYDSRDNCNAIIKTEDNELIVGCMNTVIPNSVISIGSSAFYGCSGLTSIIIPNSVTSIGSEAFTYCSSLTSIEIPSSVTYIGSNAFSGTAWLDNQPDGLVYVGKVAYQYIGEMPENTEIIIQEGTLEIANAAFSGCSGLTSIIIPNSVTSIGLNAFYGCSGLTSVTIGNGVTTIGNSTFYGCSSLTSVTIPNSVTSIDDWAFYNCSGLTSVALPNSVTSIGRCAFAYCSGLASIEIPNSVTFIGGSAFSDTQWYNNQPDGLVYIGKVAYKYKGEMPKGTEITIKEGTLLIGFDAFYNCSGLTSITIPNSVTTIDRYAFSGCSSLTSIEIPSSVTYIGAYAFHNTRWLDNQPDGLVYLGNVAYQYKGEMPDNTEIYIKEGTTGIVENFIGYCRGLISVAIPNSVTNIGSNAFSGPNLTDIYFYAKEVPETKPDENGQLRYLFNFDHDMTLHVPAGSIEAYKANWLYWGFKEIVPIYETIGDANCDGEIDLVDVVAMTNAIIGKPHVTYNPGVTDLNDDNVVDIFDVMLAISLVLNNNAAARSMTRATGSTEGQAMVTATADGIMLGVNDPARFTAFQFDVEVSDGVELTKVRLTDDAANHTLHFIKNGQNTYRVVGVSMSNSTLADNGNGLVELSFSKSGHVVIDNIVFVTPQETKAYFASGDAVVTGIDNIGYGQAKKVFDLSGRKVDADCSRLPKGVYIIDNKKVVIK